MYFPQLVIAFRDDILIFLTGQEEIESVVKNLRDASKDLPAGTNNPIEFTLHI